MPKQSTFIEQTTVSDDGYFGFWQDGTNYRITKANLVKLFGLIGSIEQDGSLTGTPVLDIDGTTNKIRNIEDGQGVKGSVSAENGVTIEHNFEGGGEGQELLVDNTSTLKTLVRSLVQGTGINIAVSASGNALEIEATGITTATNIVVVNAMEDFPTAVAGVITLADSTAYLLGDKLTTSDRFVMGDSTLVYGTDSYVSGLTYTGVGTMFTGSNGKITLLEIGCPNGQLLDFTGTGTEVLQIVNNTFTDVHTVGTLTDLFACQITDNAFLNVTTAGISFVGNFGVYVGVRNIYTVASGTMYNLGTAVFSLGWTSETSFATLSAGATFLDGAAASANMAAGALGTLVNTRFSGAGTPLATITSSDARWQFSLNDDIRDTRPDGLLSMNANATATVISVATTPVLVAGTWTVESTSQFTGTAAGRLTYNGEKTAKLPICFTVTGSPVSGVNKQVTYHIYKNGLDIGYADQGNVISSGSPKNTSILWQEEFTNGDYIELYVSNDTDTIDILITDAIMRIN